MLYATFGGRAGLLEAIYRRGFELLEDAITAPRARSADQDQAGADPHRTIVAIATAYRRFALGNPALYALMFERPLPGWFIDSPEAGEAVLLEAVRAVLTGLH